MAPKSSGNKSVEGGVKKARRSGPKAPEFSDYLMKIRKELAPDLGCSTATMHLLNGLISKFADNMVTKTGELARYDKKETMKQKHALTAGNMLLVGPLSGHAFRHATEALDKFKAVEAA